MDAAPERLSWQDAAALMAEQRGVVMVVGATDTGKTTLTLAAANRAVSAGLRVAVLDTDLGQSEVGPPGTLGVVRLEAPAATLTELKPRAMAFVGATTPVGHLLAVVQGARRLASHALERGDELVLVDTSGLVQGRLAEKLKLAKLTVLEPALVVVIQRERELERLADLMAASGRAPVVQVQSPPEAQRKSPIYRRLQRANRLRRHFATARRHELDAGQVRLFDSWFYTGEPLPARDLQRLGESLKTDVVHGEVTGDGVFLCTAGRPDPVGRREVEQEFGRRRLVLTPASSLQGLMVGLVGEGGRLIDIGILQGVNFERALFSILTPARSVAETRVLHFGRWRVRPDGSEIEHLRPGDL